MTGRRDGPKPARHGVWALLLTAACQTAGPTDVASLADRPPAPYSVLVTGAAVVDPGPTDRSAALGRTFDARPGDPELIPLPMVVAAFERARVFVRVEADPRPLAARREAVTSSGPDAGPGLRAVLATARSLGHDHVIVVYDLRDAPIEDHGVNDRWPVAGLLWVLIGLGALVPEHTFESQATLHAAVWDPYAERRVFHTTLIAGPVELALITRGSLWGLLQSVIVPPFLVASDPAQVRAEVGAITLRRLLYSLARELKSEACKQSLRDAAVARATVRAVAGGVRIDLRARESLSLVRLEWLGVPAEADPDAGAELARALLASERADGAEFVYGAVGAVPDGARGLRVGVQSVFGAASSSTHSLGER